MTDIVNKHTTSSIGFYQGKAKKKINQEHFNTHEYKSRSLLQVHTGYIEKNEQIRL